VSGDDPARKVELHLLGNLKVEAFSFGSSFDDPKRIFLRARGIDVEGFAKKAEG
jgi:hypothetical protein